MEGTIWKAKSQIGDKPTLKTVLKETEPEQTDLIKLLISVQPLIRANEKCENGKVIK
jgi:hypothetical protein